MAPREPRGLQEEASPPLEAFEVLVSGPENADLVKIALSSEELELKLSGLFAVGRIDPEKTNMLQYVLPLLEDPDAQVRALVASVLPFMGTEQNFESIVDAMTALSRDRVVSVRLATLEAIEHLGADALPLFGALKRASTDPHGVVKMVATTVACSVAKAASRPELALPIALVVLGDSDKQSRVAAANCLGKLDVGGDLVFKKLYGAADDPSADVRAAALFAMRAIDPPRAWSRCVTGIDDPNQRVVAVAGACLKGVRGEAVDEIIDRFHSGNDAIGRAMAILLAAADPSVAQALSREANGSKGATRALMEYSLWHLSRRAGLGDILSRWERDGDWSRGQLKGVIHEVVGFSSMNANLESVKEACSVRWGGDLILLDGGDELECSNHHLRFTQVGVRMIIQDYPTRQTSRYVAYDEENDLSVEYQARFQLEGTDELGLQVTVLQLLEDAGCRYIPDRLPESAACVGPGGKVEVRLVPGSGIELIKPLAIY